MGLGAPPIVTLAAAREAAMANKRLVHAGDGPIAQKRKSREIMTFATAAEQAIAAKSSEFRSDNHRKQWRSTLDTYAVPFLGALPVGQVNTADVLCVLQPIWTEKTETASRLRGRIEAILSWAKRAMDGGAAWQPRHDGPATSAQPTLNGFFRCLCLSIALIRLKTIGLFTLP